MILGQLWLMNDHHTAATTHDRTHIMSAPTYCSELDPNMLLRFAFFPHVLSSRVLLRIFQKVVTFTTERPYLGVDDQKYHTWQKTKAHAMLLWRVGSLRFNGDCTTWTWSRVCHANQCVMDKKHGTILYLQVLQYKI